LVRIVEARFMMKLSRMTDYGVVVLSQMAQDRPAVATAPSLAEATGLPAPSVSKLLKAFARAGLVSSQRGHYGGYKLARSPDEINVAEIIAALEGPVALTACVDGAEGRCGVELSCPIRGRWDTVNTAIRLALEGISLSELSAPNQSIFDLAPPARAAAMSR
jgi:FeS assembly SUF system regulator